MRDTDVINHIKELCTERGWTYYRLAKATGIPYSTLSNMIHRHNIPTIPTLQKICDGMDISLPDFFAGDHEGAHLTKAQHEFLDIFSSLNQRDKQLLKAYAKGLAKIV